MSRSRAKLFESGLTHRCPELARVSVRADHDTRQLVLPLPGVEPSRLKRIWRAARRARVRQSRPLRMTSIEWIGFDMDYTLAIYHQERDGRAERRAHGRALIRRGYPGYLKRRSLRHALSDPRPARRQALRPRPQDGPLQGRPPGLPRHARLTREELASSTTTSASARTRRATTGSTRCSRSARSRATPRSSTRSSARGEKRRLRQALPRHPRVHRRGAPRRHHLHAS